MCGSPWLGDNLARGPAKPPGVRDGGQDDRDRVSDLDDLSSSQGCVHRKRDDRVVTFVVVATGSHCSLERLAARDGFASPCRHYGTGHHAACFKPTPLRGFAFRKELAC